MARNYMADVARMLGVELGIIARLILHLKKLASFLKQRQNVKLPCLRCGRSI